MQKKKEKFERPPLVYFETKSEYWPRSENAINKSNDANKKEYSTAVKVDEIGKVLSVATCDVDLEPVFHRASLHVNIDTVPFTGPSDRLYRKLMSLTHKKLTIQ